MRTLPHRAGFCPEREALIPFPCRVQLGTKRGTVRASRALARYTYTMNANVNGADRPSFDFDGRAIPVAPGATIAAALIAAGERVLRQSRLGDPRGVFCGMGICQECLVTVDGRPGQRACMTVARPGMRVNRSPALVQLDRTPPMEPQPTRGGEVSSPPNACMGGASDRGDETQSCDLLVVGGGPAGLAAAALAAEAGLRVVLLDERTKLGGQYFKQPAGVDPRVPSDRQFAAGRALIRRVIDAGVEVHSETCVWGAFGLDAIDAVSPRGRQRYSCRALVLAPGAYERGVPFPGWTLPGVMTTGAAQTLWRSYGVAPGKRVLVSGNGPLNMQVAAELTRGGASVAAVVELAGAPLPARGRALIAMARAAPSLVRAGLHYRGVLARARVPVIYGATIVRADGGGHVHSAQVAGVDSSGRPDLSKLRHFEVDAICLGFGFIPSTEAARSLGCRHQFAAGFGHLQTVVDACGATSVDGVWVVGDGAGIRGAWHAQAQGELAALDVLRKLGVKPSGDSLQSKAERAVARQKRFQEGLAKVYHAPILTDQLAEPDTAICRCEGVTRQAVSRSLADGAGHAGTVKRETRAGMGPCQGRYCGPVIGAMVARSLGEEPGEMSGYSPSPPMRPVEIGALVR